MEDKNLLLEFDATKGDYCDNNLFHSLLIDADDRINNLAIELDGTTLELSKHTVKCDKIDYALAASIGVLSGLVDIFLVGTPGNSLLTKGIDKLTNKIVAGFAKLNGIPTENRPFNKVLRDLEKKFKVPYDQSVGTERTRSFLGLTPSNHHFKSLGHNPTLLGLFFSIYNQFTNTSSFVENGSVITMTNSDGAFELHGKTVFGKVFCGFINWIGHLISDVGGSLSSKGRGMGIPSPFMSLINDIVVAKNKLHIQPNELDKALGDIAIETFENGYDARFELAKSIPIILTNLLVRVAYYLRRFISYLKNTKKGERNIKTFIKNLSYDKASFDRMELVAHVVYDSINVTYSAAYALIKGKCTPASIGLFLMKVNVPELGVICFSLLKDVSNIYNAAKDKEKISNINREIEMMKNYKKRVDNVSAIYNDKMLLTQLFNNLNDKTKYKECFELSIQLAKLREVDELYIINGFERG